MNTIGIVEFKDIPTGIWTLDKIIKNAEIGVYKAGTTCPGKYFFIIYGDNESVKSSLDEIKVSLKMKEISGVSKEILEILKGKNNVEMEESIAIVEYTTISESISSLDHVLKNTDAKVLKLVLGYGIAGKSYYAVTGDVSSIEEAVVLVTGLSNYKDLKVINNPSFEMKKYI